MQKNKNRNEHNPRKCHHLQTPFSYSNFDIKKLQINVFIVCKYVSAAASAANHSENSSFESCIGLIKYKLNNDHKSPLRTNLINQFEKRLRDKGIYCCYCCTMLMLIISNDTYLCLYLGNDYLAVVEWSKCSLFNSDDPSSNPSEVNKFPVKLF